MPGHGATLDQLASVRVYVKRQKDYGKVRAVCERRLGELPTIYAVADVCRPNLLVEIEGMAFSPCNPSVAETKRTMALRGRRKPHHVSR